MSTIPQEAIEAAAKALRDKYAAEVTELPVESFIDDARAALEAAGPYLIREARATELETAAEALWPNSRPGGVAVTLRARAAAIRAGEV